MIGGYLPGRSLLHRLPAGAKLIGLALLSVLLVPLDDPFVLALALAGVVLVYAGLGRAGVARLFQWRALLPVLVVIGALQLWATTPTVAAASLLRILLMVLLADLVTLSTRLQDMMDALMVALRPFERFGLDARRLSLAVALVLRFVPVLIASWHGRAEAWRARSPRRPGLALVGAFFTGALKGADQVAEALDARGFSARQRED
ncbi:energy-coupling factor transporter transmembrane component T family protein [Xanthobacter agilis]|uniref:energy-coupling factor transporter transmembrane component T family protein n=1 Tax=Xanthobacter agilis TaxID=47492 RepID=UPI003728443D